MSNLKRKTSEENSNFTLISLMSNLRMRSNTTPGYYSREGFITSTCPRKGVFYSREGFIRERALIARVRYCDQTKFMYSMLVAPLKMYCLIPSFCFLTFVFSSSMLCRRIENPRIILLDCNLEYKKGESMVSRPLVCVILISRF